MKLIIIILVSIYAGIQSRYIGPDSRSKSIRCGTGNETFHDHTPFSYIIDEPKLCYEDVYILNYVQSSSDHFERRNLIRETWGSLKYVNSKPVKLLFILGRPQSLEIQGKINNESNAFRDIVQADFVDTYMNLTLKHVVALHWIHNYCPQAKFISKTDDDTFIDVFSLSDYLDEYLDAREVFILGQIYYNETPIRQKGFKWTVDKEMYAPNDYPPFIKGFAYLISQAAIKPLLVCSYYQKFLYIDDVFITGLVALKAKVILKNFQKNYGFVFLKHENLTDDMLNNVFYIGRNVVSPNQWRFLWRHSLNQVL